MHQLQALDLRLLAALQMRVVVPGYVPKGYTLQQVRVEHAPAARPVATSYQLRYGCNSCAGQPFFSIQGEAGPVGGPDGDREETVRHPVFGPIRLAIYDPAMRPEIGYAFVSSDWFGLGPMYFHLLSGDGYGAQMPLAEARKVLQGLTWLK